MASFQITVGKEELCFAAAHFITFQNGECEPLHGHNYRVGVTLSGEMNEAGYVADFIALKEAVRGLIDALHHRVLLPTRNPRIEVVEDGARVTVRCGDGRYEFPKRDVRLLPISNTTAELLAVHLAGELTRCLCDLGLADSVTRLEVEVEEAPGQSARYLSEL